MPWGAPAARMIEHVAALRAIWTSGQTGETLDFRGEFYTHTLMTPTFTPESTWPAPRILLAAVGSRMIAAAAAVADGLLLHPFTRQRYLREVTLPAVSAARAVSAAPDRDFEILSSVFVVTGRDEAERAASQTAARAQLAFYGSTPAYRPVLALHGWDGLGEELIRLSKTADEGRWRAMGRLIDDEVLDAFAVVGTADEVGPAVTRRFGDVATGCQLNLAGVADEGLPARLVASLRG